MSKSGLETVLDNTAKVLEGISLLSRLSVSVGIPSDRDERHENDEQHDRHVFGGSINNAELLYVHENGAPEVGIPARPTLKPGVENAQGEINRRLKLAGEAALAGKPNSVRAQFAAAGTAGASTVKAMINSNVGPPLAPRTLQARKRRGVKRTNTLVDTGQMRNAVTYVVREDKS